MFQALQGDLIDEQPYWLSEAQIERLKPFLPKSHGKARVDDRHVLSGIIFINRNGLCWCDARWEYGPAKDPLQPLEALERQRSLRPDHGGPDRRKCRTRDDHDRRDLSQAR